MHSLGTWKALQAVLAFSLVTTCMVLPLCARLLYSKFNYIAANRNIFPCQDLTYSNHISRFCFVNTAFGDLSLTFLNACSLVLLISQGSHRITTKCCCNRVPFCAKSHVHVLLWAVAWRPSRRHSSHLFLLWLIELWRENSGLGCLQLWTGRQSGNSNTMCAYLQN